MKRRPKTTMPDPVRAQGQAAFDRYETDFAHAPVAPHIRIERDEGGWCFSCPYPKSDARLWEAMLFQVFGTRSMRTVDHFLNTLTQLVGDGQWDDERRCWLPKEDDFQAALNIIHSLDPQNEAQAAYAAQLVALHLSSMKLGAHAVKSYADPRTTAILAKTVRAYGDGLERFARLQGKIEPKQVNQTIQVTYTDNRSVHFNGGDPRIGGQPHGTERGAPIPCTALPSPCSQNRQPVPIAGSEREESLPNAWWGRRLWRTLRRT